MRLSQLDFIVTEACNFRCSYCPQTKREIYMKSSTITKAVDFFYPLLEEGAYIVFCGGEPLLAFDKIREAVFLLREKDRSGNKSIRFSLTTNGSLVTEEMLAFFDSDDFKIVLSFDGLAQDIGRKEGSREMIERLIEGVQLKANSKFTFSTNSVFSPATVNYLSASLQSIIGIGIADIEFVLADNEPWDEKSFTELEEQLADLTGFLVRYYKRNGTIPLSEYRKTGNKTSEDSESTFICDGGRKRMAIGPDEMVWGCFVFHSLLKERYDHPDYDSYCFGSLDELIGNFHLLYPRGMYYYGALEQDCFRAGDTRCYLCEDLNSCRVCPADAAFSSLSIGEISPWICRLNRIQKVEKLRFLQKIESITK